MSEDAIRPVYAVFVDGRISGDGAWEDPGKAEELAKRLREEGKPAQVVRLERCWPKPFGQALEIIKLLEARTLGLEYRLRALELKETLLVNISTMTP